MSAFSLLSCGSIRPAKQTRTVCVQWYDARSNDWQWIRFLTSIFTHWSSFMDSLLSCFCFCFVVAGITTMGDIYQLFHHPRPIYHMYSSPKIYFSSEHQFDYEGVNYCTILMEWAHSVCHGRISNLSLFFFTLKFPKWYAHTLTSNINVLASTMRRLVSWFEHIYVNGIKIVQISLNVVGKFIYDRWPPSFIGTISGNTITRFVMSFFALGDKVSILKRDEKVDYHMLPSIHLHWNDFGTWDRRLIQEIIYGCPK